MLKKFLAAATALCLLFPSVNCFAASNGTLTLRTGETETASGAYDSDGVLYLALDPVCRQSGYTVSNETSREDIRLTKQGKTIQINPSENQILQNGHTLNVASLSPEDTWGGGCTRVSDRLYMRSDLLSRLLGLDVRVENEKNTVTVLRIIQNILTVKTKRTDLSEGLLTATIQYPVLSGPWNSDALDSINAVFKQAADSALGQGRRDAADLKNVANAYAASGNDSSASLQCSTYFDYNIEYNQNGLFSIILSNYQYAGGAHGSTIQTAYTFDLNTGKQLKLADFMQSGSDYLNVLNSSVRSQIDSRVTSGELYEFSDSPFQTLGDNPDFYLSGDGFTFYFQQYEHFPYVAGIQKFPVSYSAVSQLLESKYSFCYQKLNRIA